MRCIARIALGIGLIAGVAPASGQDGLTPPIRVEDAPSEVAPRAVVPPVGPSAGEMAEAAAARVVAGERLRVLGLPPEKGQERDKAAEARLATLREAYKARERLLDDWDKAVKARIASERPEVAPEDEAAALKETLERTRSTLARAAKDPKSLLPDLFRASPGPTTEAVLAEMKDLVAAAQDEADDLKKSAEAPRARAAAPLASAKADREEVRKRIAALGPRAAELEAKLASAASSEDREAGRERLINLDWERRVESERLKEADARIALEGRRAPVAELKAQVDKVRLGLAAMTLELEQAEYRRRVDLHQADLKRASATENALAARANDPLERYRALRAKEILDQKVLMDGDEREFAAAPEVELKDQTEKAEKAAKDFDQLKALVENPRSSALVAQRLNNSFRRLAAQRASIVRHEQATILAQLSRYENALAEVEMEQLNDDRGDRALWDNLLASLPASRKPEATDLFAEMERQHRAILEKRRGFLAGLVDRADKTRLQVLRHLQILDEQHAFVRTHLFWVRDSQPMGLATAEQLRRDARDVARTAIGITVEAWSSKNWGRGSTESALAVIGLVGMPYLLHRGRKALRAVVDRERAAQAGAA